jgi:antirestriction protein ArdC
MKTKRQATPAQKQAAAARRDAIATLAKKAAALPTEERAAMLAGEVRTIEGHALSPKNQILLIMQRPSVSFVGGFQQWKKAGRQVRKGEKSLALWIPIAGKKADEESGEDSRPLFRLASVFDITQTDAIG